MNTNFWLATFTVDVPGAGPNITLPPGRNNVAIEVLEHGNERGIVFSLVDDVLQPRRLRCIIGFTNAAKACNVWHDRGFPLLDSTITIDGGTLRVVAPSFRASPTMAYEEFVFTLSGIVLGPAPSLAKAVSLVVNYDQVVQSPDSLQPDVLIGQQEMSWRPHRDNVRELPNDYLPTVTLNLGQPALRSPTLGPLSTSVITSRAAWSGEIRLTQPTRYPGKVLPSIRADEVIGAPSYRFEDVDVLGFRIDLRQAGRDVERDLAELIRPLNFHLDDQKPEIPRPHFRYRGATSTVLIELLRYRKMKANAPVPPITKDDCQSQHELLARVLVGRVEEDGAQGWIPSVYVPALFVDNAWSKLLGRDLLGFDKRIANFCTRRDGKSLPLLPDGRPAATSGVRMAEDECPVPLGDVSHVNLADTIGTGQDMPLLDLDFSPPLRGGGQTFSGVDLDLGFGSALLRNVRWRQDDFEWPEFVSQFARRAISESIRSFRCLQTAPLVERGELARTWIEQRFVLDPIVRVALPLNTATLTLHAAPSDPKRPSAPSAPDGWNLLCRILGDGTTATIRLPFGSWYRLHCSMDLTVTDGLH